ncbi:Uncharacterised protein [Enterobacter hormaechei]|uniref:hypothetical protein n=1 Tax=Enterobacteriaceae TaxID=543 RepID=UPI00125712C3|nr:MULTISPECIES: hypothetical protein [Enterobacteriaceae]MCE9985159.1 hypothetical protein [Leclercia adecarboxylata]VAE21161.1 Uncharacterised protein [Enterobacter hormaechei]VAE26860.1 Uncharacterised protein [Enterobacter hormaechei]
MIRCDELLYLNELPEELQEKAVCSWLDGRRAMIVRRIRARKVSARRNIHVAINDKYHIYGYFRDLRTLKRLREDENEREEALFDDLPLFSAAGDFYLFPRKMFTSQLLAKLGLVATAPSQN